MLKFAEWFAGTRSATISNSPNVSRTRFVRGKEKDAVNRGDGEGGVLVEHLISTEVSRSS